MEKHLLLVHVTKELHISGHNLMIFNNCNVKINENSFENTRIQLEEHFIILTNFKVNT